MTFDEDEEVDPFSDRAVMARSPRPTLERCRALVAMGRQEFEEAERQLGQSPPGTPGHARAVRKRDSSARSLEAYLAIGKRYFPRSDFS